MYVPPRFIPDETVTIGEQPVVSVGPGIPEEDRKRARERANMDGPHPDDPPKCPVCGWWLFEGGQCDHHDYYCGNCRYRGPGW